MKKLIAFVLSLILVIGVIPFSALSVSAAEALPYGSLEAVYAAQAALEAAQSRKDRGLYGFVEWMLEKPDLTQAERADLNRAQQILDAAMEEDFSSWAGGTNTGLPGFRNNKVVVLGDPKDAVSFDNIQPAIEVMKTINQLRAGDDNYTGAMQRNPGKTNFCVMAIACSGADRGAGLRRHSRLQISCENLAFGYAQPTDGWYIREKAAFDAIKKALGITSLTQEGLAQIEQKAREEKVTIGHYTNLMWSADQVMGVGRTQYHTTSCYNATKASNYAAFRAYTVEEFESLFAAYRDALNLEALQAAYNEAMAAYQAHLAALEPGCPTGQFSDVPAPGHWSHSGIDYCVSHWIMGGTSAYRFSPKERVTRAMLVQMLWALAGRPQPRSSTSFSDVPANAWYAKAVAWAKETGVTGGTGDNKFAPQQALNRQELVAFLYRYAESKGGNLTASADLSSYSDAASLSGWARKPMAWAVGNGLLYGKTREGKLLLAPHDAVTREMAAVIMMQFQKRAVN